MPQIATPTEYRDLSLEDLAHYPVKLGFEFEFASRRSHNEVGADIGSIFGRNAVGTVSNSYAAHRHSGYDKWNITYDSSIEPAPGAEYKVELISPVMESPDFKAKVESVFAYLTERRAVTGTSTGMHITVSHPNVSDGMENFDALKFGLLIDDIAMTRKFRGNLENRYASSLLSRFAKTNRDAYNNNRIRQGDLSVPWSGDPEILFLLNTKEPRIRRAMLERDKYRSINLTKTSNHLVEVRSPGGDYIAAGAADAIETARRILSALVYACSPEGGTSEYRTRFITMFDQYIKPRPRPTVHNSPNTCTFTVPGFPGIQVEVMFNTNTSSRDIDGWDIRQTRATHIQAIRLTHSLPAADGQQRNSIFSPAGSTGARSFSVKLDFRCVCSEAGLLEENYESTRTGSSGPLVVVEGVSSNVSEIRGLAQATASEELLAKYRELFASNAFRLKLKFEVQRVLLESIHEAGAQRIFSLAMPERVTDRTDFNRDTVWRNVQSTITNAVASQRQNAERATRVASPQNFSAALQERLANLRAATSTNPGFIQAPQTATTTHIGSAPIASAASAVEGSLNNTYIGRVMLACMSPDVRETPVAPAAAERMSRLAEAISFLHSFNHILTASPAAVAELMARIEASRTVARELEQCINSSVPSTSDADTIRRMDVPSRQALFNSMICMTYMAQVVESRVSSLPFGTIASRGKMASLIAMFRNKACTTLSCMESIRGQAALVHSPGRTATAIQHTADVTSATPEAVLTAMTRTSALSSIFRPTHVGRIREVLSGARPNEAVIANEVEQEAMF